MKKVFCLILILALTFSLQGCTGIFGGNNQRELGQVVSILSDGENKYLEYEISLDSGHIQLDGGSFKLSEKIFSDGTLSNVDNNNDVVVSGGRLDTSKAVIRFAEGYEYLSEQISEVFSACENFEIIVLKSQDKIFGAINCYKRASGRSGNLLSNEDFKKSYLFDVADQKINVTKELDGTAVLALNESYYIAYEDKTFYSVSKYEDKKTEICKDIWWDKGPTFYSYVYVYFVDDIFMICGNRGTTSDDYITLIVGDMGAEQVEILIDDKISK